MPTTRPSSCKICRREGVSLCGREKCAFKKRSFIPGVHGPKYERQKPRLSSFGVQLREKQKAKRLFNLMERQFQNIFAEATRARGNTAEMLVQLLEFRLDNVVYRLGLAKTRRQARQMVSHKFIAVNGQTVNIPSFRVDIGDLITIRENKQKKGLLSDLTERLQKQEIPSWLAREGKTTGGKVVSLPQGEDLRQIFDPRLIVEFYSR